MIYFLKPALYIAPHPPGALLALMIVKIPAHYLLLDHVSGALIGLLFLIAVNVIATLIFRKLGRLTSKQWAMGFGDAILLAAIGLFVGASHLVALLFLASLLGSIIGIAARFANKKKATTDEEIAEGALPYGPFLAIAAIYIYLF